MLHVSGLIFLTNAIHALSKRLYVYTVLFMILTSTTFVLHRHDLYDTPMYWIDQIAIFAVVALGSWYCWNAHWTVQIFSIITIAATGYLYIKAQEEYPNDSWADAHALMHLISSIGHHGLILGLFKFDNPITNPIQSL